MKRRTGILSIILTLAIIGGLVTAVMIPYERDKDIVVSRTYEGRLYLDSEEYEAFKQYLVENQEVVINRLDVLGSPNVLVEMSLESPVFIQVPYGEVAYEHFKTGGGGYCFASSVNNPFRKHHPAVFSGFHKAEQRCQ